MEAEGSRNLTKWLVRVETEDSSCAEAFAQEFCNYSLPFLNCRQDQSRWFASRKLYQFNHCRHQPSMSSNTLVQSTNLSLLPLFQVLYHGSCYMVGLPALRLIKQIRVYRIIALRMLHRMFDIMINNNSVYHLRGFIDVNVIFVGRVRTSYKNGRCFEYKTHTVAVVESRLKKAGAIIKETLTSVSAETMRHYLFFHLLAWQTTRKHGQMALRALEKTLYHERLVDHTRTIQGKGTHGTNLYRVFSTYMLGTCQAGINKYLQGYVYKFVCSINWCFWEFELPSCLLNVCMDNMHLRLISEKV